MPPGHDKLGPPRKEMAGSTRRHLALWPFKHPITAQHVDELLRFSSGFLAGEPEELHTLLHLLYLLSPGPVPTDVGLDLTAHGQQLRRTVVTPHDSYGLLSWWRALPLALLEGRAELPDAARVSLVKHRVVSLLRSLDVDFVTLGFPLRRLPALTLLVLLRMIDLLRPPPDTDPLGWDHSASGEVDQDMLLADAAERDDGWRLLTKIEQSSFDSRSEGLGAQKVLHSALRCGNAGALRLLLLRYPHMHNSWVDVETGMAPVHYLAEGGPGVGPEKADAILPLLFPFSSTVSLDGGIWPAPRSLYYRDPTMVVGTTALHLAVSHRSLGVLSALLSAGASVNVANRLELTPLALALCCRDYNTPSTVEDAHTSRFRLLILEQYRQACVMLLEAGAPLPSSIKAANLGPYASHASADLFAFCKGYKQSRKPAALLSSMRGPLRASRMTAGSGDWGKLGVESYTGTPEMEKAARDIQRVVRGRLTRLHMKGQGRRQGREAQVCSPSCLASSGRSQRERGEEEAAARRIQKVVRGRSVRRKMGLGPSGQRGEGGEEASNNCRGSVDQWPSPAPPGNTKGSPKAMTVGFEERGMGEEILFMAQQRPMTTQGRPGGKFTMDTMRVTSLPASRNGRAARLMDVPNSPYARENRRLQRPPKDRQKKARPKEVREEEAVIVPTVLYASPPPRSPWRSGGFTPSHRGAGV